MAIIDMLNGTYDGHDKEGECCCKMNKQIEEIASDIDYGCIKRDLYPDDAKEIAKALYLLGYRKIHEGAVVIPKEISCYENIEERVRTFRLDGNKVDFTDGQIMALTQILHFKERNENEIRKKTVEKFAERLKAQYPPRTDKRCTLEDCYMLDKIDEIAKEIMEGK